MRVETKIVRDDEQAFETGKTVFLSDVIARVQAELDGSQRRDTQAEILRGLIYRVTVLPDPDGGKPQITLEGSLAGILSLSQTTKNAAPVSQEDVSQVELVAGVGFEPTTFRL